MKISLCPLLALTLLGCAAPDAAPSDQVAEVSAPADDYDGPPRFAAPGGWVEEEPANSMRLVQFSVPGDGAGQKALTCIVSSWPNGVGPLEMNLSRWSGQVGIESAADLAAPSRTSRVVRGHTVTTLHVEGPLSAGMSGGEALDHGAVLAAFVESPDGPAAWTIKLQGPADQVAANRDAFDGLTAGL